MYNYYATYLNIIETQEYYNLDPAYYASAPSLTWDAMLLCTGVKLELIHDLEM